MGGLGALGLSLAGGAGVVLGSMGPRSCPWWWSVIVTFIMAVYGPRGALPHVGGVGAFFSLILVHFDVSCVGLLSKTKTKTKTSIRSQK